MKSHKIQKSFSEGVETMWVNIAYLPLVWSKLGWLNVQPNDSQKYRKCVGYQGSSVPTS